MKDSDTKKIKELLTETKLEYKKLSELYLIKNDIIEATDKRRTLSGKFEDEINKLKPAKEAAEKATKDAERLIEKLATNVSRIDQAIERTVANEEQEKSNYDYFLEITSDESIDDIEKKTASIQEAHDDLFSININGESKLSEINKKFEEIKSNHAWIFSKVDGETSRNAKLNKAFDEINNKHSEIFNSPRGKKSKYDLIVSANIAADKLVSIIEGSPEEGRKPLTQDIEDRLESLKNVEDRAKSILDLSSEAGLAAGFAIKVKEARRGQIISASIFALATIGILTLNIFLFNESDFKSFKFSEFAYKALMNAPLIWLATIANMNMNSFARSEQIYSHKEALAKSFERYKTEINELSTIGVEDAPHLKSKLININLDAFMESPANSHGTHEKSTKSKEPKTTPPTNEEP